MKKSVLRVISLLLAVIMLTGGAPLGGISQLDFSLPFSAKASAAQATGSCGESVTYSLNNGVLTVSGTGDMTDFANANEVPWRLYLGSITTVNITGGVTSIGSFSFKLCALTQIEIASTVTKIGNDAFAQCLSLSTVTFKSGSRLDSIGERAFSFCTSLEGITLPSSLRSIGYYSFQNCTGLKNIVLPDNMNVIGERAFYNCESLISINIPEAITTIGYLALVGCNALESINVSPNNRQYSSVDGVLFNKSKDTLIKYPVNKGTPVRYSVPTSVITIAAAAFEDNSHIQGVFIPRFVYSIGDQAFHRCSNLTSISVEESSPFFISDENTGALYARDRGTLVLVPPNFSTEMFSVPSDVREIADYSFFGCDRIKTVRIEKSVTQINGNALGFYSSNGEVRKYEDFTIYCFMDSAAQRYAVEKGLNYELIDKPWDGTVATEFADGNGSAENPYIISTAQQLALMAGLINGTVRTFGGNVVSPSDFSGKSYELQNDINLNDTVRWNRWLTKIGSEVVITAPEREWTPIATFSGVFDGKGFTINGVYVSSTDSSSGLFDTINGGTVRNLGVTKSAFYSSEYIAAPVAGVVSGGTVTNCYSYGTIIASDAAGGIVGTNSGTVEKCYAAGTVISSVNGGGIAGANNSTVQNCYSTATVSVGSYGGGIVGRNSGTITNCYNVGAVTTYNTDGGTYHIGGIAGTTYTQTVSGCYYSFGSADGGIDGADAQPTQTAALIEDELENRASFVGWDFTSTWTMLRSGGYPYPSIRSNEYKLGFLPVFYAITVQPGKNGAITPGSSTVPVNSNFSFTVIPDEGYSISSISINGIPTTDTFEKSQPKRVTIYGITKEQTITCTFTANSYDAVFDPGDGAFVGVSGLNADGSKTVSTVFDKNPRQPGVPVLANMQFDGWEPELAPMTTAGATYVARYVSTHSHNFGIFDHRTEATCLDDGEVVHRCTCGDEDVEVLTAVGYHVWNEQPTIDIAPTCTEKGEQSVRCAVCDEIMEGSVEEVPALGHNCPEDGWVIDKEPECTLAGIKSIPCQNPDCDYVKNPNTVVEPLGHRYNETFEVLEAPTCTKAGKASYRCIGGCGTSEIRTIEPLDHDWGEWETTLEARCTAVGSKHRLCQRAGCNEEEIEEIPMKEHQFSEWSITVEPTCGSTGIRQRTCSTCPNIFTETVSITHQWEETETVDVEPTCISAGSKSIHCSLCGERSSVTAVAKLEHSYGEWQTVRAATSTQRGLNRRVCTLCAAEQVQLTGSLDVNFTATKISAQAYTGKPVCPAVTVKGNGATLVSGTDYFIEYYNNTAVGTAAAVVTGIGRYKGSVILNYSIVQADISKVSVKAVPGCIANGLPQRPEIYATFNGIYVEQDKDFTCTYSNNVAAGTATAIMKGIGNFTGTKTVTFAIAQAGAFTVEPLTALDYIGSARNPTPVVRSTATGNLLSAGTDYTVKYTNNTNAGYASVVVTGNGAYAGVATVGFIIKPKDISSLTIPAIPNQTYDGSPIAASFRLIDGSKELIYGTDYVCTFGNNIAVGTATVQITGAGNYIGTASGTFAITRAQASNFSVTVAPAYYTGNALTPAITVKYAGIELTSGVHYTAVYSNNINMGTNTGVITLTGLGSFTGQKTVKFSIVEKPVTRVSGISLDKTSASVAYDKTIVLTASILPADATNKNIKWSSSGGAVTITPSADGSRCTVKGVGRGTATVRATSEDGSHYATCTVTATMTFWQRIVAFFRSLFGGTNSIASIILK